MMSLEKKMPKKNKRERTKYFDAMVAILEREFPKGKCLERGRALCMLSYIELLLQGFEFGEDGLPIDKANKRK